MGNTSNLNKAAEKALLKKLNELLTKSEQEVAEWGNNKETKDSLTWIYSLNGLRVELVYSYNRKMVTVCKGAI